MKDLQATALRTTLTACVITLLILFTGCASWSAVVARRGAEASDQTLDAALWTICNATPVGAIKRRFKTPDERAAYNAICPDNQLP